MKMTRRQLALAAAGSIAAAPALMQAQNPPPAAAPNWDQVARDAHHQSAQDLLKVDLPMLVEPAFQFKA